jgi:hypothetical protein
VGGLTSAVAAEDATVALRRERLGATLAASAGLVTGLRTTLFVAVFLGALVSGAATISITSVAVFIKTSSFNVESGQFMR